MENQIEKLTEKEALQLSFDILKNHPSLIIQQVATLMLLFKNMSEDSKGFQEFYFRILLKDT